MLNLTTREIWTSMHGIALGGGFLLAYTGAVVALMSLRPGWTTPAGRAGIARRLVATTTTMAALAWFTAVVGTFVVYPWYRAKPPDGRAWTADYPRSRLLADPATARWHTFGMEWKEHVGWLAPVLATAAAAVCLQYGSRMADHPAVRRAVLFLLTAAFASAGVAGLVGAMINKLAPVR